MHRRDQSGIRTSGVAREKFAGGSQHSDLAAGHLQGPEKTFANTDHLLSLVEKS